MLGALGSDVGAAECHGMLCGLLCAPRPLDRDTWHRHLGGQDDAAPFATGEPRAALDALHAATAAGLAADDYSFTLLLPGDDEPLAVRAEAFAGWCRGFLSGLGLTGIADLRALGEDARDFLHDLARMGALSIDAGAGEEEERALAELAEFARMGTLLVRAELGAGAGPASDAD